jgi:hypothetical protein
MKTEAINFLNSWAVNSIFAGNPLNYWTVRPIPENNIICFRIDQNDTMEKLKNIISSQFN